MAGLSPSLVDTPAGQLRVWRCGGGAAVVVLPGLAMSAQDACAQVSARLPSRCVMAIEWPGVGGSAAAPFATLEDVVETLRDAIAGLGARGARIIAFDLGCVVAARLGGDVTLIEAQTARGWAEQGRAAPDAAPRADGTHLTALFAHLRDCHLMDAQEPARARRSGPALPDDDALDRAVVAASVDPRAYMRLWTALLDAAPGALAGAQSVELAALAANDDVAPAPAAPQVAPRAGRWRRYVDIGETHVHVRCAGRDPRALLVLQSAPGSAEPLAGVIEGLAATRRVFAPDYPGNGDSGKIVGAVDIGRLARLMLATADALDLATFDLWGTHTGALVALEIAVTAPERVGRAVLEAPPLLAGDFSADILANYLPPLTPDRWGLHLQQAWNMRRDMFVFWPWYRAERAAIRPLGLPDTQMLHDWTVGLLKSGATYDRSYRAAFEYDTRARLPLLQRPTLICAGPTDMLADSLATAQGLAGPHVEIAATPATVWYPNQGAEAIARTLAIYRAFLERDDRALTI